MSKNKRSLRSECSRIIFKEKTDNFDEKKIRLKNFGKIV